MGSYQFNLDAASELPDLIRFGTSSWTYPGWQGSIYQKQYASDKAFRAESLEEYCRFPWFRTVGIDSTFYGPPAIKTLERYREQTPDTFTWIAKAWEQVSIPVYGRHKRYGQKAGQKNEHFLDAPYFEEHFIERFRATDSLSKTAAFVFQFQAMPVPSSENVLRFIENLDGFLKELPKDAQYAIEVRNPEVLRKEYFETLNRHNVAHCFNHWTAMVPLVQQMKHAAAAGGLTAPLFVSRLLTPHGMTYQEAVSQFSPYSEVRRINDSMREDALRLIKRGLARKIPVYILVNNRSEGYAPATIDAIGTAAVKSSASV